MVRVVSLVRCDGNIDDDALLQWEANGNISFSMDTKFGRYSLNTSNGGYLKTTKFPEVGIMDWTAEVWVKPTAYGGGSTVEKVFFSSQGIDIRSSNSGILEGFVGFSPSGYAQLQTALSLNIWNHVALQRCGQLFSLLLNGEVKATYSSASPITATNNGVACIGACYDGSRITSGNIGGFRFTLGKALYSGSVPLIRKPFQKLNASVNRSSLLTLPVAKRGGF